MINPPPIYPVVSDQPAGNFVANYAYDREISPLGGGVSAVPISGLVTSHLPVEEKRYSYTGGLSPSFSADWYHRVHIRPNPIALGNLLSEQSRDVEVWNAHLTDQLLSSIAATDTEGLQLTAPYAAPTTFKNLESRLYQLSVYTTGPPRIDADFTFNFPAESPVLSVTGTRIVIFPFRPNWRDPLSERLEWLTDLLPNYDGTEQRIRLREIPRRIFEFRITLHGMDKRRFEALLWEWQARVYALPIWTDPGRLDAQVAVGSVQLSVSTDDLDYHVGGLAILISDTATVEAVEILSVQSDGLTLMRPLLANWPANSCIYPARSARLDDTQSLNIFTSELSEAVLIFRVEDNSTITAVDSPTVYRSYPVLESPPNWRDNLTAEYQRQLQHLDNLTGIRTVDDESGRASQVQSYLWTRQGRGNIRALRAWLYARAGRVNPIWVSSFQADLVMVLAMISTDTVLTIENIGYTRYLRHAIGRRDIVIRLRDGTRLYRRIIAVSEVDSQTEWLTLDSAVGQDVTPADVVMISWLQLTRLESDAVELTWHTPELVECQHQMRGLADDV
ncbi:hypothetical protein [Candidatus Vondammii sp. HM_W22]|uniref:hypothetical protein n=1 Tax=Candidatus Vondammii sp. HM_W22 TaxID=2687299 RepID=UPI002E7C3C62|nr:hypothetical protein [Candidatus Vondammii sp. HM_W22]